MAIQIIHVVLGKANPNRMNGVNKVVNSLANAQSNLGYDVTVWGITKTMVNNYPKRNYKTLLHKDNGRFFLSKTINAQLKLLSPNTIFHIHGGFIPQFYLLAKKLKSFGFEFILTPHGAYNTIALKRSARKKNIYIRLFENYVVKTAKCIHLIGKSEVEGTQKVFGNISHVLIPNGQELSSVSIPFSKNGTRIFGFIGRLDIHTKGLDVLLTGFAKFVSESKVRAELWILGDGQEKSILQDLSKQLNICGQVIFWGSRFGDEKIKLMHKMDYLCLTSRNEGLPGVVLEAASMGIPAIVSKATNMGKYIRQCDSGWLLAKNSALHLAKILKQTTTITLEKQSEMRVNAVKMIENQFNWTSISKSLIQQYEA